MDMTVVAHADICLGDESSAIKNLQHQSIYGGLGDMHACSIILMSGRGYVDSMRLALCSVVVGTFFAIYFHAMTARI